MILKKLSLSLLALVPFAVLALWCAWSWGMFPNIGAESGYYGQFNRVKHVLDEMPQLQVTNDWQHHDITLEDFGFYVVVNGAHSVRVDFWENSPQMKMRDKSRIREFIEEQIKEDSNQQVHGTQ